MKKLSFILLLFTLLLLAVPSAIIITQGAVAPSQGISNQHTAVHGVMPYTTTTNTTSKPWWVVGWDDVTGAVTTAGSDAASWLADGLVGTYNAITSNIGNFFGNIALNAVEGLLKDTLGAFLSLVELAAAEVMNLFSWFITLLVGLAITPALGPFGPVLAGVLLLSILVLVVVLVRLVLDVA